MKLVYASASPYVRKVMVLLHEANALAQVELIDGMGSPVAPSEAAVAANPVGKIPCLVLDNGDSLYDSRVICQWLDMRFQLGMYPNDESRWRVLNLEAHADAILDAAVLNVYEHRCRDESIHSSDWIKAQQLKITRALDALENNWMPHLNGPVSIGHIGVACALDYLRFRQGTTGWEDWREGRPDLAAWADSMLARESFLTTQPA